VPRNDEVFKMHIIFLTHYFPPEVNAPATRTFEHCRYWVKAGNKVTVITGTPNAPEGVVYKGYKNKLFQWQEMDGIRILRVWTFIAPNKGIIKRILNHLSFMLFSLLGVILIRGGDIVIATSPQFFCGVGGYLFSRLKRRPFVLEVRDLWPDSIPVVGAFYNKRLLTILKWIELFIYRHADKIVVLTDSFKKIISKSGIPEDKIEVIKNGVDLNFFRPQIKGDKIKEGLKLNDKFIVSYIGTLGMAHALAQVLRLAALMRARKEIIFLLVGSGAEKEFLMREKERCSLDNVMFIDKQPKERVPLFYAFSDICLVSLKKDPLFKTVIPSKIFEIMAMAKPILLGVDGETRDLVINRANAGLYFESENINDFKEKLNNLYNDKFLRDRLGANGRKFVEENFNRKDLAFKFLKILKQV